MSAKKKARTRGTMARGKAVAPARTPKFNAYQPIAVGDGIVVATHHTFDSTLPFTADDQAALEKYCDEGTPRCRILTMQARLAALEPITNPYIQAHADTIRTIHARLKRFTEAAPQVSVEQWMGWSEEDRVKRAQHTRAMSEITEKDEFELERAEYLWGKIVTLRDIVPEALDALRFKQGRKPGTGGPIRKAIARLLKKKPLKNAEIWQALSLNPPRGWQFLENRLGKYIEGPRAEDGMGARAISPTFRVIGNVAGIKRPD